MNGHVFQCYSKATEKDQYSRIIKELDSYVSLHFKHHPIAIKRMIKEMTDTTIKPPKDHSNDAGKTVIRIWEKEVDMYVKRRETYEANKCALYSVVWNQCSEAMQTKLKSADTFVRMSTDSDSLALLTEIKGIAYKFESQRNIYLALDNVKSAFYTLRQGTDKSNANYMSKFRNIIEVIEHYGGSIGDDHVLIMEELKKLGHDPATTTDSQMRDATKLAREKPHAMAFLKRTGRTRYGTLTTDLENQYTRGTDQYPHTITKAYNLLVTYKKPTNALTRDLNATRSASTPTAQPTVATATEQTEEVSFLQRGAPPPIETVQRYNCQQHGHYAGDCLNEAVRRQFQLLQCTDTTNEAHSNDDDNGKDTSFSFALSFTLVLTGMINPHWILLDSESTVSIFLNRSFLKSICPSNYEHGCTFSATAVPNRPIW